jgi:hypothetical protein
VDGLLDPAAMNNGSGCSGKFLTVIHPPGTSADAVVAVVAAPKGRANSKRKWRRDRARAPAPTGGVANVAATPTNMARAGWASSQGICSGDVLVAVNGRSIPFHKVVIPIYPMATGHGATPLGISLSSGGSNAQVYVSSVQPKGLAAKHGVQPGWALLSIVETWPFGGDEPDVYVHGQQAVSRNLEKCVARLHDACSGRARIELGPGIDVSRLRLKHDGRMTSRLETTHFSEWYGNSNPWRITVGKTVIIGNQEVEKGWVLLAINGTAVGKLAHDWSSVVTHHSAGGRSKAQVKRLSADLVGWDGDRNVADFDNSTAAHLSAWGSTKDRAVAFHEYIRNVPKPAILLFQRTSMVKKKGAFVGQRLLLELHFRRESGTGLAVRALQSHPDTPMGLGIQRRGNVPRVIHVAPGSPADRAQIKVGWDLLRVNEADVSANAELCDAMLLGSDFLELVFRAQPIRPGNALRSGIGDPDEDLRNMPGKIGARHVRSDLDRSGTRDVVVWSDSTKWAKREPSFGDASSSDSDSDVGGSDGGGPISDGDDGPPPQAPIERNGVGGVTCVAAPVPVGTTAGAAVVAGATRPIQESPPVSANAREHAAATTIQSSFRVHRERRRLGLLGTVGADDEAIFEYFRGTCSDCQRLRDDLTADGEGGSVRCDECWEVFETETDTEGHASVELPPQAEAQDDIAEDQDPILQPGAAGLVGPAAVEVYYEGPAQLGMELTTYSIGVHYVTRVKRKRGGHAKKQTVFVGQRLLQVNGCDMTVADEATMTASLHESRASGTVSLVLHDDQEGFARAQGAEAGPVTVPVEDAPKGAERQLSEERVDDTPTTPEAVESTAWRLSQELMPEAVVVTPPLDSPDLYVSPEEIRPPQGVHKPNRPWFHGPGHGKDIDNQKLKAPDGSYSTGRFFVCEIEVGKSSYPGYVLYLVVDGKPTRKKVKDEDGSGLLQVGPACMLLIPLFIMVSVQGCRPCKCELPPCYSCARV